VALLEEALVDARAGNLSAVIIFGDIRGTDDYRVWKSAHENYLTVVGKMQQACTDMCLKRATR
jgi:predicted phosphodiesterase